MRGLNRYIKTGNVAEWPKAPAWKAGRGLNLSRVRISPFPPVKLLVPEISYTLKTDTLTTRREVLNVALIETNRTHVLDE